MIQITIENKPKRLHLKIEGHSNHAEHGSDIVCASVSALAQSFLIMCMELEDEDDLTIKRMVVSEGYIDAEIIGHGYSTCLRMIEIGFQHIAEEYPKEVKIN